MKISFLDKLGKFSMLLIGLFLMSFLLAGQAFAASDVTFEWDSNTEADMSYYNIYRSDDNQVTWNKVNPVSITHTGMGTETWTDFGVPDGTYSYYATAVDTDGNESEKSNIVTGSFDTEAPAPPQNLLITLIKKIIAWIMNLFKAFRFA